MCMGVPALSPQGSPCCTGGFGVPCAAPPLCLALCILCLLPALPTWPWDPQDPPGPLGWVSLPWGLCLGMGGPCWGSSWPFRAPQAPRGPWGPTECWGPVGEHLAPLTLPRVRARAPEGSYGGDPQNSSHVLLSPSPAVPGLPHCPSSCRGPSPRGSPSRGVPCPAGVPSPRGAAGTGRTF